jgi:hypothetical protein
VRRWPVGRFAATRRSFAVSVVTWHQAIAGANHLPDTNTTRAAETFRYARGPKAVPPSSRASMTEPDAVSS